MAGRHDPLPAAPARRGRRLSVSARAEDRCERVERLGPFGRRRRALARPRRAGRIAGDGPPAAVAEPIERLERRLDHAAGVVARDARSGRRDRGARDVDRHERRGTGRASGRDRVVRREVEGAQDERDVAAMGGRRRLRRTATGSTGRSRVGGSTNPSGCAGKSARRTATSAIARAPAAVSSVSHGGRAPTMIWSGGTPSRGPG